MQKRQASLPDQGGDAGLLKTIGQFRSPEYDSILNWEE
jgi:hypothetical protein